LTQTTNKMAEFLDSPLFSNIPTNPSQMHVLQRHREILYDYSREFNRTRQTISSARAHADLLSGSSMISRNDTNSGMSVHDRLLNERDHIDGAHGIADSVLEQANLTREALDEQGRMLANARGRLGGVLGRFPAINNLVQKINTKKRRDQIVIAVVLGVCLTGATNRSNSPASKVIVVFETGTAADIVEAAAKRIEENGGTIWHRYTTTLTGFAATISDSILPSFTDDVHIQSIEADGPVSALFKPKN
ncbi:Golgi SNAP receptor complex member 1, partial [Physocladia obscura]